MSINFRPFDSGDGSGVLEAAWSQMASGFGPSGIKKGITDELELYADSTGMQVKVKAGEAMMMGHHMDSDAVETLAITASHATLDRIDNVVVEVDWVLNTVDIVVEDGTPGATPSAPALVQTASKHQIKLGEVYITALDATVAAGAITKNANWAIEGMFVVDGEEATIATGAITLDTFQHSNRKYGLFEIDTEADAANDD